MLQFSLFINIWYVSSVQLRYLLNGVVVTMNHLNYPSVCSYEFWNRYIITIWYFFWPLLWSISLLIHKSVVPHFMESYPEFGLEDSMAVGYCLYLIFHSIFLTLNCLCCTSWNQSCGSWFGFHWRSDPDPVGTSRFKINLKSNVFSQYFLPNMW